MGAPSFSAIKAAGEKFGLSDAELQQGLDAFSKWHQSRFGSGFTNTSSEAAIINGAIQNALNFRTDAGWKNWDVKNYEGAGALNNALNYSATPERIAAHRADAIDALATGDWGRTIAAKLNNENPGFGGDYRVHSMHNWTPDEIKSLAALAVDTSVGDVNKALQNYLGGIRDAGADSAWWGPQAVIDNLAKGLGKDSSKYIDPKALAAQQNQIGTNWQENEIRAGQEEDASFNTLVGVLGVTALGFASALGAPTAAATAEAGATAAAAGDAGFLTAGGVSTPATGGMFVGNSGLLGGTGNAIADAALNGAVRGGVTSALTGGDVGKGLISGGLSGGISSALPSTGNVALDNAARGAVSGGVGAAVNGGDVLTGAAAGGAASGVGTLVRDAVGTDLGGNTLANAAAGGAAGAVGSAIAGGDVGTGLIRGAVTGGTAGALQDAGVDPTIAGAAGTAAGGLINSPTPDAGTPAAQQQQTATEITSGLGFSVVLPEFRDVGRRNMQWGTRLQGAQ